MKTTHFHTILTFLTILQSYSLTLSGQDLQFYREDIVFTLSEGRVSTEAIYNFCNLGQNDIKTPLFYPFPDSTLELIDSLVITDLKADTLVPYREGRSGIFFPVTVKAYGQAAYRVDFRQRLVEQHFTYILTSTETWGRALEFANFELQVPAGITVDSLSYTPDSSFIKNDIQYFFWKKKDFKPKKDFLVLF